MNPQNVHYSIDYLSKWIFFLVLQSTSDARNRIHLCISCTKISDLIPLNLASLLLCGVNINNLIIGVEAHFGRAGYPDSCRDGLRQARARPPQPLRHPLIRILHVDTSLIL